MLGMEVGTLVQEAQLILLLRRWVLHHLTAGTALILLTRTRMSQWKKSSNKILMQTSTQTIYKLKIKVTQTEIHLPLQHGFPDGTTAFQDTTNKKNSMSASSQTEISLINSMMPWSPLSLEITSLDKHT